MGEVDGAIFDVFMNEVVSNVNVFAAGVVGRIIGKSHGAVVVTEQSGGIVFEET